MILRSMRDNHFENNFVKKSQYIVILVIVQIFPTERAHKLLSRGYKILWPKNQGHIIPLPEFTRARDYMAEIRRP